MNFVRSLPAAAMILAAATLAAQTSKTVLGSVTGFKAHSLEMDLQSDDGKAVFVKFGPETQVVQIQPGERDLSKSKPAKVTDISPGDRVMVSFVAGMEDARRIILVSSADIAAGKEAERLDWQKRGISGVVSSKAGNEIAIESRTSEGARITTVVITDRTRIRRYAADSIRFGDAESSTIAEIAVGDEVRARGEMGEDAKGFLAEDVVFGTFLTKVGTITSVDREAPEITIDDLTTKKPATIRLTADSRIKKMPAMRGGSQGDGPRHGPPAGAFTIAQMLERLPAGSLDDCKVGSAVVVTSTRGATPDKATAIMIVANVDAFIQIAQMHGGSGASPLEALGRMHGGMMGGPGGFSLPAMIP